MWITRGKGFQVENRTTTTKGPDMAVFLGCSRNSSGSEVRNSAARSEKVRRE